ncbi:LuxR C-terminal-related transcriptional regulator [Pararhodobacter sp. CCB-MM2]|uniref:helix-turn-helix transcriptional regulator n=1 Tax=Pararhodobacter sp. CCB-MM2 TaxID=1786003 RepID=UPI000835F874|nr:LuxR C-terminal-related transcriptional regulator [Pararhodobacter sp. CCB-MM2]MCA2010533.1 LuxR C-terminal-related transcriptional regulator [Cereibacter sphaeroides]
MSPRFTDRPAVVASLITAQTLCAAYFLVDVLHDATTGQRGFSDFYLEGVATFALITAIAFEIRVLMGLLARKAHLERQMNLAAQAFHEVVEQRFADWGLTAAERDVAHFMVKGLSNNDIAELRQSAIGTVKSQLTSVYRKAGVGNRGELLSLLIEDLVATQPGTPPSA